MKKHLLSLMICTLLFLSLLIENIVSAEGNTEVIYTSDSFELSKVVHEMTDNKPSLYSEDDCDFPSDRIIVLSDIEFNYCGAEIAVTDSDGMYVLFYSSKSNAQTAYKELIKNPNLDVIPDMEVSVPTGDDYDNAAFENTYDITISSSHLSWGSDFIGTDAFIDTLLNNYDDVDEMPKITVAVIDTGVDYNHPFLSGRIIRGYDYANSDKNPMDDHGHGTHVAGIICDNTLSNVEILAYKVLDSTGNGSTTDTIAAIKAAQNNGADIINLSLGAEDYLHSYYYKYASAYMSIINKGVTIVAAAGNESMNSDYVFPANMDEVITVSACAETGVFDNRYSNYGSSVDICAPGTYIYSTILNDSYGTKSGTSMACPHAAAAAALLKTANPELTPTEIEKLLQDSAIDAGAYGFDNYYGYGLLNLNSLAEFFYETKDPSATPTPESGLPSLCSASITDDGYMTVTVADSENIPENGATVAVAGYKTNVLSEFHSYAISGADTKTFLFTEDNEITEFKIYLWDTFKHQLPISKIYKLDKGDYLQ